MTETVTKPRAQRPKRTPISGRNILTVKGKDPGYEYRIVNDTGDRVEMFKNAGWELVDDKDVQVGDRQLNRASAEGSKAQVSVGGGQKAFVMRISKDWYEEDQKAKMDRVAEIERSMKQQALSSNDYGNLEISRGLK